MKRQQWIGLACIVALVTLLPCVALAQEAATGGSSSNAFLTNVLGKFKTALKTASEYSALGGATLAVAFLAVGFSWAGAKFAFRMSIANIAVSLGATTVYALFASQSSRICAWFADGMANAMTVGAGVAPVPGGILSNPSLLMSKAFKLTESIFKYEGPSPDAGFVAKIGAVIDHGADVVMQIPVMFAGFVIVAGFAATAGIGMKAVVISNIHIIMGTTLVPFLILPITRPIGMAGIQLVVAASVQLGIRSALVGVGFAALSSMTLTLESDFQAIAEIGVAAVLVAWICTDVVAAINLARGRF
jgi:hypothetical protein